MKNILFTLLGFFSFMALGQSQSGYEIDFDIKNYDNDTLIIGYYYGNRNLVQDTLFATKKGKFSLKGEEALKSGVYLALLRPDNKFAQFMVNDQDQKFKVQADADNFGLVKFKGSKDNDLFYGYLDYLSSQRPKANSLREKKKLLLEEGKDISEIVKQLDQMDLDVLDYQNKLIKENPNTVTSLLVKGNITQPTPSFTGTEEEIKQQEFDYYKAHYFDYVELDNPTSLRTPFLHTRIDNYVRKLTPQIPDSVIVAIDYILDRVKASEDTYRFYLGNYTNETGNSKVVGEDAIFVHLVDNYYSKGLAPWASEENVKKLEDSANRLRPVLIGKTVPDITLYKEDGSPYKLSDVPTDYTVIMFWAPDCGHCKKALPDAIAFNEKFKDQNVTFLAVCTKQGDKYQGCWDAIKEKNMEGFLNLGDQYGKSRFKRKFNVRSTPKMFILDKNREILIKNIGAKQLESVMNLIIENAEKELDSKG